MSERLQAAIRAFETRFGGQTGEFRDSLMLAPENIVAASQSLREEFGFELLTDLTAVDYWPEMEPRYHLVYNFLSVSHAGRLSVRVPISGADEQAPTIEQVYFNANWFEREIFDMFGISFEDHSDMRRILMPADWEGHPLRKDYPLGYEEVQFTFNFEEIDTRKPYAKE